MCHDAFMNYYKGFIVSLLLIILAGGVYLYEKNKQENQPIITTLTAQTAGAEIAGWKTYRNETYGFTLQYPQTWERLLKIASEPVQFSDGSQGEALLFTYDGDFLFSISIYTRSQWVLRLKVDYPNPVHLTENSSFVFAYTATQNGVYRVPDSILKDVDAVIATLKLQ